MSRPDAEASAALDGDIRPVFFAFLDILGDPVRANTSGKTMAFGALGLPGLDNQTFSGINADLVEVSPVRTKQGGSDTVTAKLSGLLGLDAELMNVVGDPANWQGRTAQLWRMIRDSRGSQQGGIQHYYTGYMVSLNIDGDPDSQAISVDIEGYLAAFSEPSNRTYLDQEKFDPGDLSARASIAIANGVSGNPLVSNTRTSSGWKAAQVRPSDRLRY